MDLFGKKTKQLKQKIKIMESNLGNAFSKVKEDMTNLNAWLNYYHQKNLFFENQINKLHQKNSQLYSNLANTSEILNANSAATSELKKDISEILNTNSSTTNELKKDMAELHNKVAMLQSLAKNNLSENQLNFHIEKISTQINQIDRKVEHLSYVPVRIDALKEQLSEHISKPDSSREFEKRLDDINEKLTNLIIKKSPRDKLIQKVTKNSHDYVKAVVLSYIKKYEKISAFQLREMVVEEQNLTSKSTFYRILEQIEDMDEIGIIKQGKEKIYLSKLKKTA